jgi:hypothetical protein
MRRIDPAYPWVPGSFARSGPGLMAGIFRDLADVADGAANLAAHQRIPVRMS